MREPEQRTSPPDEPKVPALDIFEKLGEPSEDATEGVMDMLNRIFTGVKEER